MFPDLPTLFIGNTILSFEALPSTNEYALELLTNSSPTEGTVISARFQSKGRGQFGNTWQDSPGKNLACSIILAPDFLQPQQQFLLSQVYSLAARETIQHFAGKIKVQIKWPNDIIANDKKLAGILIQNNLQNKSIRSSVGGVGINVNQTSFSGLPHATSLSSILGKKMDPDEILRHFLIRLEHWYLTLRQGDHTSIENSYLKHLFGLKEQRKFSIPGEGVVSGIIRGIDPSGKLRVEIKEELRSFDLKQIAYLYESEDH